MIDFETVGGFVMAVKRISPEVRGRLKDLGIWMIWCDHRTWATEHKFVVPEPSEYGILDALDFADEQHQAVTTFSAREELGVLRRLSPEKLAQLKKERDGGGVDAVPALVSMEVDPDGAREGYTEELKELNRRSCSWRKSVEWVLENLGRRNVSPREAPGWSAWQMLEDYGKTPTDRREFRSVFGSKLLPTRSQIELEGKMTDDGRELQERTLALLDSLQRDTVLPPGSEDGEGEFEVPFEDGGVGGEEPAERG